MALVLAGSGMELRLRKCLEHRSLCWTFHPISVNSSQNSVPLFKLEGLPFFQIPSQTPCQSPKPVVSAWL